MKIKIRTKLLLAISLLIIVLFSIAAYLFITEKKRELSNDIYLNTLAFVKLTGPTITDDYDLYLAQNSFVYFNREIQNIFLQNDDVGSIKVISYPGELLYDSEVDVDKKFDGELRIIGDPILLEQARSENISFYTSEGDSYYLKSDLKEGDVFVDVNENRIEGIEPGTLIDYFVIPASEEYAVAYFIDYHNLELRINTMIKRIIYLVAFGIMLGMFWSFLMAIQLTRPVTKLVDGVEKIARGDFKTRVEIKTNDELKFLGDAFNRMAADLEASIDAKLYQERVVRELELAKEIQEELLPKILPTVPGIEISADLIAAGEIGGDMYDFLQIDPNRLLFYLGDVTGHGVPAGIVSSIASALFYGYSNLGDLKQIVINVNRVLKAKTLTNIFMTLCLMEWNSLTSKFYYVSAGHEQIIRYTASTGVASLAPSGGIALGMLENVENNMNMEELPLETGDFLVIYSDGIPEAWQSDTVSYGMDKFVDFVQRTAATSPTALGLKDAILNDVKTFMGDHEQADDITIIVVKRI